MEPYDFLFTNISIYLLNLIFHVEFYPKFVRFRIQLRMYDVKVNVVDHYFRPRLETDTCLINHSKILEFIRAEM